MNQVYQKCDVCKGRGCIDTIDYDFKTTAGPVMTITTCIKCKGTGFIETDLFVAIDVFEPYDFLNYITPYT